MSKQRGTYKQGGNIEVQLTDALDPRVRWESESELFTLENWPNDGEKPYAYNGLIAAVGEEVWELIDKTKWNTKEGWKVLGSGGGEGVVWVDEDSEDE